MTIASKLPRPLYPASVMLAAICILASPISQAANTLTGTINVQVTLIDSCAINGTVETQSASLGLGTLDFGAHSTLFTQATGLVQASGAAPISIQCSTTTAAPTLKLVSGANDANTSNGMTHAMASGSKYVPYSLYSDSGYANSIANGATFFTSANNGTVETVNVYGKAVGATGLTPGTYTDTVTVALTF